MSVFGRARAANRRCIIEAMPQAGRRTAPRIASYRVIGETVPERRGLPRRRVFLRSGKLIDTRGGFLGDCRLVDIGDHGVRLVLEDAGALPRTLNFYDDLDVRVSKASIVWRQERTLGLALRDVLVEDLAVARWQNSLYALNG